MKKLLTLIILTTLVGCRDVNIQKVEAPTITYASSGAKIETFLIDGCQYIGHLTGAENDWATHKGNCTNSFHNRIVFYQDSLVLDARKNKYR